MKIIFTFCVCFPILAESQPQFYLSVETSYATYKMRQMKDIQSEFIAHNTVRLEQVASFPGYFGYGVSFGLNLNSKSSIGSSISYNSTGGRADYEDYSGLARRDQLLYCFSFRSIYKSQINKSELWPLFMSISASWVLTQSDIKTQLTLGSQTQTQKVSFNSTNYGIQPSLVLQRNVRKNLFLQASAGYEVQLAGKLYYSNNIKYYLLDSQGKPAKADWSGVRFGLGAGVFIGKGKTQGQSN